jgi:transcriptional regulator GlxA family with amidase domain
MAYRKHLDKRPLQSLRLLRLAELRRLLLQSASPSRRLMEHLDRCGLSRSGSTARHYRERYGEKPSQTRR